MGYHPPKHSVHAKSVVCAVLFRGRIHRSGGLEVKVGVAQLTINSSDPLLECVLPVHSGFCKVRGPGFPRGNTATRGHSKNPITF